MNKPTPLNNPSIIFLLQKLKQWLIHQEIVQLAIDYCCVVFYCIILYVLFIQKPGINRLTISSRICHFSHRNFVKRAGGFTLVLTCPVTFSGPISYQLSMPDPSLWGCLEFCFNIGNLVFIFLPKLHIGQCHLTRVHLFLPRLGVCIIRNIVLYVSNTFLRRSYSSCGMFRMFPCRLCFVGGGISYPVILVLQIVPGLIMHCQVVLTM